jgi:tetratricopeptide (TPR) repeat protein
MIREQTKISSIIYHLLKGGVKSLPAIGAILEEAIFCRYEYEKAKEESKEILRTLKSLCDDDKSQKMSLTDALCCIERDNRLKPNVRALFAEIRTSMENPKVIALAPELQNTMQNLLERVGADLLEDLNEEFETVRNRLDQWRREIEGAKAIETRIRLQGLIRACDIQLGDAIDGLRDKYRSETYIGRDVDRYLTHFLSAPDSLLFPLVGPPGSGKTSALCCLATWLRKNQWPGTLISTRQMYLYGANKSALESVILTMINEYLSRETTAVGLYDNLHALNTELKHALGSKRFVVLVDGLDEILFLSRIRGEELPISPASLARMFQAHQDLDRFKFVISCRESPWGQKYATDQQIRRLSTVLPERYDEELALKTIEQVQQGSEKKGISISKQESGGTGPQLFALGRFNDVEFSLATAQYQIKKGIRVHFAGTAWEEAKDPFLLGTAFEYWERQKQKEQRKSNAFHFYYVKEQNDQSGQSRGPSWSIGDISYFRKLADFWDARSQTVVEAIIPYTTSLGEEEIPSKAAVTDIVSAMVDYMIEQGTNAVPMEDVIRAVSVHGWSERMIRRLIERMSEAELLSSQHMETDRTRNNISFFNQRHLDYQLGARLFDLIDNDRLDRFVELVKAGEDHEKLLREPFRLALRRLCSKPNEEHASICSKLFVFLLNSSCDDYKAMTLVAEQLPFMDEKTQRDTVDLLVQHFAYRLYDIQEATEIADVPKRLSDAAKHLRDVSTKIKHLPVTQDSSGSKEKASTGTATDIGRMDAGNMSPEDIIACFSKHCETSLDIVKKLARQYAPLAGKTAGIEHTDCGLTCSADVRTIVRIFAMSKKDAVRNLVEDLAYELEAAAILIPRISEMQKQEGGVLWSDVVSGQEQAENLRMAVNTCIHVYDELSEIVDALFKVAVSFGELPNPESPEEVLYSFLANGRTRNLEKGRDFVLYMIAKPERTLMELGDRLVELVGLEDTRRSGLLDAETLHNQGNNLYKAGEFAIALRFYDLALRLRPDLVEMWFNRALALTRLRNYAEAAHSIDRAIKGLSDSPAAAEAYYVKGLICEHQLKYREALQLYEQGLKEDPGYDKAKTQRDVVLKKLSDVKESVDESSTDEPDFKLLCDLLQQARKAMAEHRYTEAEWAFNQAVCLANSQGIPLDFGTKCDWVLCLLSTVKTKDALRLCLAARDQALVINADRDSISSLFNSAGCIYSDRQDFGEAAFYYLASLAARENSEIVQGNLADTFVYDCVQNPLFDPDAAENEARRLLAFKTEQAHARGLYTLAEALLRKGRSNRDKRYRRYLRAAGRREVFESVWANHSLIESTLKDPEGLVDEACDCASRVVHRLYPITENAAVESYIPSSLCGWYSIIAMCAGFIGKTDIMHEVLDKIEELISGKGPGSHVGPGIRVYFPAQDNRLSCNRFLEECRKISEENPYELWKNERNER